MFCLIAFILSFISCSLLAGQEPVLPQWPTTLQTVLKHTRPISVPRGQRLPLFVLPISGTLAGLNDASGLRALQELDQRGIGYTADWKPQEFDSSVREGIRIARWQQQLGQPVAINANACLHSFFDGTPETQHVDREGHAFEDESHTGHIGCPFALQHRIAPMRHRLARFVEAYRSAGVAIDLVIADWEIDGPLEWNDSWAASRRCTRCREQIAHLDDFLYFQAKLRSIRSQLQREAYANVVTSAFPDAKVGNYGVYPHDGYRYWYDYYEQPASAPLPFVAEQRARYRPWYHEYPETGFTLAMPVIYTWYPIFHDYDFKPTDYRWFYNMLKVGSNAGQHASRHDTLLSFVHWHTTAPPKQLDPQVTQFSESFYQELLWHLLLRGHDSFFLWCTADELAKEIELVHEVYAESLAHTEMLSRGTPISFQVPRTPQAIISGVQLGRQVLARRTNFAADSPLADTPLRVPVARDEVILVAANPGLQLLEAQQSATPAGFLSVDGKTLLPIGTYELPKSDDELKLRVAAGVNLFRCEDRADLDRVHAAGALGWIPLPMHTGATAELRARIGSLADHPALAVWEGPDEIVWTFTAYSGLQKTAGYTRADWESQQAIALSYAREQSEQILPNIRAAADLVRSLDKRQRPIWINEAADSDATYSRAYMPSIDITGCDYYPVRSTGSDLTGIGRLVDRWNAIGQGKPVWMVLQDFSWHTARQDRTRLYPSFQQSRFMAYDALAHGARGLLYWGSWQIDDPNFRAAMNALTSELAMLNAFLVSHDAPFVSSTSIDNVLEQAAPPPRTFAREQDGHLLLVVVNDSDHARLGVEISGLAQWNGRQFYEIDSDQVITVTGGRVITRLQGHSVRVFSTDRRLRISPTPARDYVSRE